jgi:hypothetical protein
MDKLYISIGIDCGNSQVLNDCEKRKLSLPFDWVVTYNGVTDIIKNDFEDFLPLPEMINEKNTQLFNDLSCTFFPHNVFPRDYEKMQRRIDRFRNCLKYETTELIFIRKGHFIHNHDEANTKFNCVLKNEIDDCEELYDYLKTKYPKLIFKIVLLLTCNICFDFNKVYDSDKITITNISNCQTHNENQEKTREAVCKLVLE